jgi:hypothetical protein
MKQFDESPAALSTLMLLAAGASVNQDRAASSPIF